MTDISQLKWNVHKFGGSSLASSSLFKQAAAAFRLSSSLDARFSPAVVVSACGSTTNALLECVQLAKRREKYEEKVKELIALHREIWGGLVPEEGKGEMEKVLQEGEADLLSLLRAVYVSKNDTQPVREAISSYGEFFSAQIMKEHLRYASPPDSRVEWIDARDVLFVDVEANTTTLVVQWEMSKEKVKEKLEAFSREDSRPISTLVVTGFIATDQRGIHTTLQRNGSDWSATIFGALLGAGQVTIWTDVDGMFSSDPRKVEGTHRLSLISFEEALELAYFGAQVIHPSSLSTAMAFDLPVWIRSSALPEGPGTVVYSPPSGPLHPAYKGPSLSLADRPSDLARVLSGSLEAATEANPSAPIVKGVSSRSGVSLLNVSGSSFGGIAGFASRLINAVNQAGISIILISQAGSEHSICIGVTAAQSQPALKCVEKVFAFEIAHSMASVELLNGMSILAAVGDKMCHHTGVAADVFASLAYSNINIIAIAQGSSEKNISLVVEEKDEQRALQAVHRSFYTLASSPRWKKIKFPLSRNTLLAGSVESGTKRSVVGLIGPGLIGSELLEQFRKQASAVQERGICIEVVGIMSSKKMLLSSGTLDLTKWKDLMEASSKEANLEAFASHLASLSNGLTTPFIIDCTSSETVSSNYASWMSKGIKVVTPNKKAISGPLEHYNRIRAITKTNPSFCRYETTVGAGLPVVKTLQDLVETGHAVSFIEGVFSGTLSFIFNTLAKGEKKFSSIVLEAKASGFTEPDPRDDLSGMDVARKVTILARELGIKVELGQVKVEGLVPKELQELSLDDFLSKVGLLDEKIDALQEQANKEGKVLSYVGSIDVKKEEIKVGVELLEGSHPISGLCGADNLVSFTTDQYCQTPLVIRGPGAGANVTASGVFSDLLWSSRSN